MYPVSVDSESDEQSLFGSEERADLELESAKWWIARARQELAGAGGREFLASRPCPDCGITKAAIIPRNGQNTVRCARCGKHYYNAPKAETGEGPRTAKTLRRDIRPGKQARILDRDNGRCVLCGRSDQSLSIGHLLSIEEGRLLGADEGLLNDDANLAAMCEACNLGLSAISINSRTYVRIIWRLVQAEIARREAPGPAPAVRVIGATEVSPPIEAH